MKVRPPRLAGLVAALISFIALGVAGCANGPSGPEAIPQERKLVDRLLSPDQSLSSQYNGRAFYSGKKTQDAKSYHTKDFQYVNKTRSKQLDPGSYHGVKSASDASRRYATKEANTDSRQVIPNLERELPMEGYATRAARDGGQVYETGEIEMTDFRVRGKAQGSLDLESPNQPGMSIDEVRSILNRK